MTTPSIREVRRLLIRDPNITTNEVRSRLVSKRLNPLSGVLIDYIRKQTMDAMRVLFEFDLIDTEALRRYCSKKRRRTTKPPSGDRWDGGSPYD
jgi:hypothetical protein